MKVIFNNSLLPVLSELGNTVEITNYVIGSEYSMIVSIDRLFSGLYLSRDPGKTDSYPIEAVWENDNNLLRVNIVIPEAEADKLIKTDTYKFIYCYVKLLGDTEKIGFILVSDDANLGTLEFTDLGLGITRNLIDIKLPEYVKANLKTTCPEDISFLEGPGIMIGTNIFKATEDDKSSIVSRDSYYQYLRNTSTSGYSLENLPYLNCLGEKVQSTRVVRRYESIRIWTDNSEISGGETIPTDSTLDTFGGTLQLYGKFTYTEYHIVSDQIVWTGPTKTEDIVNLYEFEYRQNKTGGLNTTIDRATKRISYPENKDPNTNPSCTIQVVVNSVNPETLELEQIESETLRLSQGVASGAWIVSQSKYVETTDTGEKRNLYLFSSQADELQQFTIRTNINVLEATITIDQEENKEEFNKFFEVTTSPDFIGSGGLYKIIVGIRTLTENTSTIDYNPMVSGIPKLIATTLTLIPKDGDLSVAKRETFYCVQGVKSKTLELFKRNRDGITYSPVTNLLEKRNTTLVNHIVAGDIDTPDIPGTIPDTNKWYVESMDSIISISPRAGIMSDRNSSPIEWLNPDTIRIDFGNTESDVENHTLDPIVFRSGIPNSATPDWKNDMKSGRIVIPVTLQGDDPHLSIEQLGSNNYEGIGVRSFKVRSNTRFTVSVDNISYISLYDNSRPNEIIRSMSSSLYDDDDGITVYYKVHEVPGDWIKESYGSSITCGTINVVLDDFPEKSESFDSSIFMAEEDVGFLLVDPEINRAAWLKYGLISCKITCISKISLSTETVNNGANLKVTRIKAIFEDYKYKHHEIDVQVLKSIIYPDPRQAIKCGNVIIKQMMADITRRYEVPIYALPQPTNATLSVSEETRLSYKEGEKTSFTLTTSYSGLTYSISSITGIDNFLYSLDISDALHVGDEYRRTVTVWPKETNDTGIIRKLGDLVVGESINLANFKPQDDNFLGYLTQDDVNELVGYAIGKTTFYQEYDPNTIEPTIDGDFSEVGPRGDSRRYPISSESSISATIIREIGVTASINSNNQVNMTVPSRLRNYSPFKVSEGDKSYLDFSETREGLGFDVRIEFGISSGSTSSEVTREVRVNQLGYRQGIVYRADDMGNTLFISESIENVITKQIDADIESITFMAGLFDITTELNDSSTGTWITNISVSSGSNDFNVKIPNTPPKYLGGEMIEITFPKNTTPAAITRNFVLSAIDNNLERHSVTISVTQGNTDFKVYTGGNPGLPEFVRFHSSGKCVALTNNVGIATLNLETNIPGGNLAIICPDSGSNGFKATLTPLGPSTVAGREDCTRYSLGLELGANHGRQVRYSSFGVYYTGDTNVLVGSLSSIRQGYSNINLTASQDNRTYYPGQTVGTAENPYITPATKSDADLIYEDRSLYSINLEQQEISILGDPDYLLNTTTQFPSPLTVEDLAKKVDLINSDINGSKTMWRTVAGSSVTEYFTSYSTAHKIGEQSGGAGKLPDLNLLPLVENIYETRQQGPENIEVDLMIDVSIEHTYGKYVYLDDRPEEVTGKEEFGYTIYQRKSRKDPGATDITVTQDPGGDIPRSGGEAWFVVGNLIGNTRFEVVNGELPDWITAIPIEPGSNRFGYTITSNLGNPGSRKYSGITVKTADYGRVNVTISQESGIEFTIKGPINVSASGGENEFEVIAIGISEITCTSESPLITITDGVIRVPNTDKATVKFSMSENTGSTERTATIILKTNVVGIETTVPIVQGGK